MKTRDGVSIAVMLAPSPIAWEFYPGMLERKPDGGYLWGGDAREIEAANDAHFFGPLERA